MSKSTTAVLIVEDDAHLLELLLETFEDVGYFVQGASGPEEAINLSKRFKFDLVISDVRMAGVTDGLGGLQAIKSARPEIKCIVITGYADEQAPGRAIHIQVDDYIYKPFRLPAMLATVKKVLRSDAERQSYLGQLSARLLSGPKKLLQKVEDGIVLGLRGALESERDKTLQGFFVAIRSNYLTQGAAMDMWDELDKLDLAYHQLDEGGVTADTIKALGRGYRMTSEKIMNRARAGSAGGYDKREKDQLPRGSFIRLFEQVKAGNLTQEQLRVAFRLWRGGPDDAKLSPELRSIHELLFAKV